MTTKKILLFILAVFSALILIAAIFPQEGVTIKMPAVSEVLEVKNVDSEIVIKNENDVQLPLTGDFTDSLARMSRFLSDNSVAFSLPNDDVHFFDDFFEKAEKASEMGKTVRILHYGDSQIEMDRMSDVLRARMQMLFGGGGPGTHCSSRISQFS